MFSLAKGAAKREVLGPDLPIDVIAIDETNTRVVPEKLGRRSPICWMHLGRVLINPAPGVRPLLGVKRTSLIRSLMSANDPKRTRWGATREPHRCCGVDGE